MTARRLLYLVLVLAICLPVAPTLAQGGGPLVVTQIDTSAYPQVRLSLAAPGGGLPDPAALQVSEDDRPLSPATFEIAPHRPGVAVAVLIDTSRSMRGQGMPDSEDRLHDARAQTIALAQALDPNTDLISVFAFHREVVSVLPLSWADGGDVQNKITNSEVLRKFPDRPGDPNRKPTAEELRNDERAFSALSEAVGRAIDELTNPQIAEPSLRAALPAMQKVVVIFADSCDDTLDAPGSKTCTIPLDLQARLQDVVRAGDLSVVSVGVGTTEQRWAAPKPPQRAEKGFLYTSRFELLQLYAQQVPNSQFFAFYTRDLAQAAALRAEFAAQVIAPIVRRGDQLTLSYRSQVSSAGQRHQVAINSGTAWVQAEFVEPRLPPSVTIISEQVEGRLVVRPEIISSQAPLARVDYYVGDSDVPIPGEPPSFALDLGLIPPGEQQIALVATDQRGDRSERSAAIPVRVPALPTPIVAPTVQPAQTNGATSSSLNEFLQANVLSLLTLLLVIVLAIIVLVNPRGRAAATTITSRVTGVIQRLTLPFAATPGASAVDYVLVAQGEAGGKEYPLANLNTYLGADPALVDLIFDDPYVSGRHASINREGDALYITDLESANGTFINRVRLAPNTRVQLQPKDLLGIGGLTLECRWRGAPASLASSGSPPTETIG
jgi:hypothetical protein